MEDTHQSIDKTVASLIFFKVFQYHFNLGVIRVKLRPEHLVRGLPLIQSIIMLLS